MRTRRASLLVFLGVLVVAAPPSGLADPGNLAISQVYGGGGNSGAAYRNDFIEIFNRGSVSVDLTGFSVQYASATGSSWQKTNLSGTLAAGQHYLVQEAAGAGGTTSLPTPDAIGSINMSATAGKVALVSNQTALTCGATAGSCLPNPAILDFVGYGSTANNFEGSGPTPAPSNTTAVVRVSGGCTDTDNNAADFAAGAPDPKNTASPLGTCAAPTNPTGSGAAHPGSVVGGDQTLLTVSVVPGTNPASTGLTVSADLTSIGGSPTQALVDDGTSGDATPGDNVFSFLATVAGGTPPGAKALPATIGDAQGRSGSATIALTVQALLAIHDIQGSGSTSPFAGQSVLTSGIVTGRKSNGFFLQTPDAEADADPDTSEGVFVFTGSSIPAAAAVGNAVRVSGTVSEFVPSADPASPPVTELAGSVGVTLLSTGHPLPEPVTLTAADTDPAGSIEQLERVEGMRVHVDSLTAIAPTQGTISEPNATSTTSGVFYGVITGVARPFREPGIEVPDPLPPGSPCCIPRFDANPERLRVDSDGQPGAPALEVTSGSVVTGLTGPVDYSFRTYTILPDPPPAAPPVVTGLTSAVPVRLPAGDEFTVASFNMERFFDTSDDPAKSDVALTAAAFDRRLAKASLAIRGVLRAPDILGVEEMENLQTLQAVADRVNADAVAAGGADPGYQAYLEEGNDIGGIDVGFLVKSSRVAVVDVTQVGKDATYTNPNNGQEELLNDRPSLVLRARVHSPAGSDFPITVIVNHLRSLSGIDGSDGNRVRTKRRAQAEFLADVVQSRQAADPTEAMVLVGDFNAFQVNDGYVDVIGTIKGTPAPADEVVLASDDLVNPDLTNLVDAVPADARYSFSFDGNVQVLDHVLVDEAVLPKVRELQYARNDADFAESFRADGTRPERISDHDMPVAFLRFPEADLSLANTSSATTATSGGSVAFTLSAANAGPDAAEAVTVADTLPAGTTFEAVSTPAGWSCATPAVGATGTVTCTAAGLAPGDGASLQLAARLDCALADGLVIADAASLGSTTIDPAPANNTATATLTVSNPPPAIGAVAVDKPVLWPPNHKLVDVTVSYAATDNCDPAPACSLSVTSDVPSCDPPDWVVIDAHHVQLRAERHGRNSRTYTITVTCGDSMGNTSTGTVRVVVPHHP